MILYLDTSAFLELFVAEPESSLVRTAVHEATAVCTHLIAYAECRAGLAKAVRLRRLDSEQLAYQVERFERDWETLRVVGVDETLIRRAGTLAEQFSLRGYDSVHLAAAEAVWRTLSGISFRIAAFDAGLAHAACGLGIPVLADS